MTAETRQEPTQFRVVVNAEEQYALWPAELAVPNGWRDTGVSGDKETCLAYVRQVWTDMTPLSLRKAGGTA